MKKEKAIQFIKDLFEAPFERENYAQFVRELLNGFEPDVFAPRKGTYIPHAFGDQIKSLERIGVYRAGDERIDILIIHLKKETSLERARTMQRNFVAGYLRGDYGSTNEKDAALVAFVSADPADWRFSLVKLEYALEENAKGELKGIEKFTPARRWSFLVGANEKSHTAQTQLVPLIADDEHNPTLETLENAFDIETISDEFFSEYRRLFIETKSALDDILLAEASLRSEFETKQINSVDFAKKLLGQIVFLYYLQKKGWFGIPKHGKWGDGSKNFLRELFDKKHGDYQNFFNDILEPLFYEALRRDRSDVDHYYSRFDCKIPFLNGGLFDPIHDYDWWELDLCLPNELFANEKVVKGDTGTGILDVFDRYNFTVREDEPFEKEVAIDPELLGKAYEKFNAIRPDNFDEYQAALSDGKKGSESKFNKKFGVYYTPREIVHYMCQQSLIQYLETALNGQKSYRELGSGQQGMFGNESRRGQLAITAEAELPVISKEEIEDLILRGDRIKEHDARVVSAGRETKTYPFEMPASIRANATRVDEALASVKVCDPAVGSGAFPVGMMNEIVKARDVLRVYEQPQNPGFSEKPGFSSASTYHFKRACIENSLYGVDIDPGAVEIAKLRLWLSLIVDEEDPQNIRPLPNLDYKLMQGNSLLGLPEGALHNNEILQDLEAKKKAYFDETHPTRKSEYRKEISALFDSLVESAKQFAPELGEVNFDFQTHFSEVFQEKGGFDVVIGNPPYNANLSKNERSYYKKKYQSVKKGRQDTAAIFVELAHTIGNISSQITYILPYRLFSRKRNHGQFQIWSLKNTAINEIVYLGSDIGFSANDEFMIVRFSHQFNKKHAILIAIKPLSLTAHRAFSFDFVPQAFFIKNNEINIFISQYNVDLLEKISRSSVELQSICNVRDGIVPFLRDELISSVKEDKRYVEFAGIAGRYKLEKYYFERDDLYLCYDINEAKKYISDKNELRKVQLRKREIFLSRKIITSQNSIQLKGTIDENQVYVSNSIHSTYLKKEHVKKINLEFLLALINSKLLNYYHNSLRVKGTDLHPQILIGDLKKLPIKLVLPAQQKSFVKRVNKLIEIKRKTPSANTGDLEAQIDALVYALYGLSPEEIAIVEGKA